MQSRWHSSDMYEMHELPTLNTPSANFIPEADISAFPPAATVWSQQNPFEAFTAIPTEGWDGWSTPQHVGELAATSKK